MNKPIPKVNNKNRIFLFTGLGADQNAFSQLKISESYLTIQVKWLPASSKENLNDYCKRLIKHYNILTSDILIGLSFGGIVVTEISKLIHVKLSILISSASTRQELPLFFSIAGLLNLDKLISRRLLNQPSSLKYYFFGLKTQNQKQLLDKIVSASDKAFVRWAIHQITHWKNQTRPPKLYKIHGTADRIIPIHKPSTDFIIEEGSHFMTWENAGEVAKIINLLLDKTTA